MMTRRPVDGSFDSAMSMPSVLSADVLNLTNAPLRYYEGITNRPIQQEYYRWWATFGVKMNF